MKKRKLHQLVPPGVDGEKHADRLYTGLILSGIISFMGFFTTIVVHLSYPYSYGHPEFLATLLFPLLGISIYFGFVYVVIAAVILAISYYRSFSQGSEALYLMRRLPDRWELARRCLTLPLATIALSALSIVVLTLIYFVIYCLMTPEEVSVIEQLQNVISHIYLLFVPASFFLS